MVPRQDSRQSNDTGIVRPTTKEETKGAQPTGGGFVMNADLSETLRPPRSESEEDFLIGNPEERVPLDQVVDLAPTDGASAKPDTIEEEKEEEGAGLITQRGDESGQVTAREGEAEGATPELGAGKEAEEAAE